MLDRLAGCAALLMLIAAAPALGQSRAEAELIKLEQDYARALIRKDMNFLRNFYASDWRGGNWLGFTTKSALLRKIQDRRYVVRSMKLRDIRVKLQGPIAIVQGVDEEVTSMSGRDTSGLWLFTDVFARRGGRWVAIASQTTQLQPAGR